MKAFAERLVKHAHINWQNLAWPDVPIPPFLILFINSLCNMKCEHCFYWQQLNQPDDLTFEELVALSEELGPIENLNLSGGEPFLRKEFGAICRQFIRRNGVKEIYVPTNAYFTGRTISAIRDVLQESSLKLFGVELSLDGMPAFHDEFRKTKDSFRKAMETYDALVELQKEDARLQIHAISTATEWNMGNQATDDLSLRLLSKDDAPQPGDHPRRPQESHAARPCSRGIQRSLSIHAPPLGQARGEPLRRDGGADASVGEEQERRAEAAICSLPRRRAERCRARQRRRGRM